MRISRPSRVMPALLTRIDSGPISLPIASISASTWPGTDTSSTRPWPPCADSRSPIAAAPDSEVAVPITVAPCAASVSAIAAPMPRLAPVTSAISPLSSWVILFLPVSKLEHSAADFADGRGSTAISIPLPIRVIRVNPRPKSAFPRGQRRVEVVRHAERAHVDALVDASGQSSQHLARTTLGHACRALRDQRLHAAGPLHGQVQLACERIADRVRTLVHLGIDVLHHRDRRRAP